MTQSNRAPAAAGEAAPAMAGRGLVLGTLLLAGGTVLSRALGLLRELVIAHFFGATGLVSVLRMAMTVPALLNDLFLVELNNSALVPVLTAAYRRGGRAELGRALGALLALAGLALAAGVAALAAWAPQLVRALGGGYDPALQQMGVSLVRLVLPAALALGLGTLAAAGLFAVQRFRFPALAQALHNLVLVAVVLLLAERFGVTSVIFGVLAAGLGQLAWYLVGLRGLAVRPSLHWGHPALRQAARLFAPVAAGLVLRAAKTALGRSLASHAGPQALAWMENALTLARLPEALAVSALGAALLPALAGLAAGLGQARPGQSAEQFRRTLTLALTWALLIALPAAAGLWALARPVVGVLFQHGAFTAADTSQTAYALRLYTLSLPLAAIDQLLVVAFYARQNTLTPVLIGAAATLIYLLLAPVLGRWLGMGGLVLAEGAWLAVHTLLMLGWAHGQLRAVAWRGLLGSAARIGLAAAACGLAAWAAWQALAGWAAPALGWRGAGALGLAMGLAAAVYALALRALRVQAAADLLRQLKAGWARRMNS